MEGSDYVQTDTVRVSPNEKAEVMVDEDSCIKYSVLSIKGDWIEVESSGYCDIENKKPKRKIIKGWAKWRRGNKIIIGKMYAE